MFGFAPQLLRHLNRTLRMRLHPERGALPFTFERTIPLPPRAPALSTETLHPPLVGAIQKADSYLKTLQSERGFWEGRVYDNITITCEYVMSLRTLGILDAETLEKSKQTILDTQLPNGGWNIYGGGPSEHSATVEAYFTLKLCGLTSRHPALRKAKELILKNGGIESTRVFTKINLAMFGEYPWSKIPLINPELMLLPKKAPIHLYEFSSWSRAVIVPLLLIFDKKPITPLKTTEGVSELHTNEDPKRVPGLWDLENIFSVVQKLLSIYELSPVKPLRKRALRMAEDWIWAHQDPQGNWGGIFPAMANSLIALHLRGYSLKDPRMQKGLKMLRSFAEETATTFRMQSTISPVWDTGIAAYALQEAGTPFADEAITRSVEYLLRLQILDVRGDWKHKVRPNTRPGGWPFEHENDHYPDIDDSALAILALLPSEHSTKFQPQVSKSIDRGIEWIVGMQGSDGGWGAFDRDNNRKILNNIPFADLKSLLDPSTPDVTGHVIEALGAAGIDKKCEPIQEAIHFLRREQEEDGSWFGRWGVNYIYGTGAVLSGLKLVGENMKLAFVRRAADWLASVQNADGGWGESCRAYEEEKYVPLGHSTASQTAWGLLGLLAAPEGNETAIERGVEFLLETQKSDGSWEEPEWTGTGFPKHFYLRYDYYRLYFPLMALGRYAARLARKSRKKISANA